MATRFSYVLPIGRQLALSTMQRFRPGGLAATLPASRPDRPFVIVTGAGRSGTSAVARVLHESGVSMGDRFGAAADVNPDGFYEDLGVVDLNDQILTELGMGSIWRQHRWPWRSTVLAIAGRRADEMRGHAAKGSGGWKDPRFAATLEAWLPHLPRGLKIVLCLRSPSAYVDSVMRIYGLVDPGATERHWARMYRRLLDVIHDYELPAHCVEYDSLVEDPTGTVRALSEFIGQPLSPEFVDERRRQFTRPVTTAFESIYEEVLSLGSARGVARSAAARQREERSTRRRERASVAAIDAYADAIDTIECNVHRARVEWMTRTGLPSPKIVDYEQLGLAMEEAVELTRGASSEYSRVLLEAYDELCALEPPAGFERYHEITEGIVKSQRIAAEVMLAAVKKATIDPKMLKTFRRFWRDQASPAAVDRARHMRAKEYRKALAASGYGHRRKEQ